MFHRLTLWFRGVNIIDKYNISQDIYLNDFIIETMVHIDHIEATFLEASLINSDPGIIDSVFRAAHSIKGTAGFFSIKKIVAVSHELESVFSLIKEHKITIDETLIDVVLESVDTLRDLVNHINEDESIDIDNVIEGLNHYSGHHKKHTKQDDLDIPFDLSCPDLTERIGRLSKKGQKLYYVIIEFNRSLKLFYTYPERLFDGILSVATILAVHINEEEQDITLYDDRTLMIQSLKEHLLQTDTSILHMLITSVLELELLSIAIGIDVKQIHPITKDVSSHPNAVEETNPDSLKLVSTSQIEEIGFNHIDQADPKYSTQANSNHTDRAGHSYVKKADSSQIAEIHTNPVLQKTLNHSTNNDSNSIILDISNINQLVDIANEMILTRNRLNSTLADYERSIPGIIPIMQDMNRLTSEIQERVMLTRMQPIHVIFGKFPRIIHDTAKELGKELEIYMSGGDVMLDKHLLDSLTDPITQLVKNSADHGIETKDIRSSLGKCSKGRISLHAYTHNSFAYIEVTDDGAGIDIEALRQKGIERGLIETEEATKLTEQQLYDLMYEPGFSTAKKVTNLSGRGVGMDIVKTNINRLGGSIDIEPKRNVGTTCTIKMPLTLSVLRTIIIDIQGVNYAVPEINVERIIRIKQQDPHNRVEMINDSYVLSLDGRILPLITLEEVDAKAHQRKHVIQDLWHHDKNEGVLKCLILKTGHSSFALHVDDITGTEQTLVKPLPEYLKNCPCYSNVTVLGNGNAIAILNAEGILRMMEMEGAIATQKQEGETKEESLKQYIIFKSQGPEYYALDTVEISRIESFDSTLIQRMGKEEYININHTIRIIHPEIYMEREKEQLNYDGTVLYLLTLKNAKRPMGILAEKVIDTIEREAVWTQEQLSSEFIQGTCTYREKILIFLNSKNIAKHIEMG